MYGQAYDQAQQQPIESASGTTSPDNGNSGPFAYIVTLVCVVILIILSMAAGGCVRNSVTFAMDIAKESIEDGIVEIETNFPDSDEITEEVFGDDFEDYFMRIFGEEPNDYNGRREREDSNPDDLGATFSPIEVLGLDLSIYDNDVNDLVSASAYAGTDAEVKEFVRDLVLADRDANEELIRELRGAARNEDEFAERLEEAIEHAYDFRDSLDDYDSQIPSPNDETEALLEDAMGHLKERWYRIIDFISVLENDAELDIDTLEELDAAVFDETEDAAQAFEDALAASKN